MTSGTHVYPVGVFDYVIHHGVRNGLSRTKRYLTYQAKRKNWRAVRNHFNGFLAEHDHSGHNAGRGWTKRAALRRVEEICVASHDS